MVGDVAFDPRFAGNRYGVACTPRWNTPTSPPGAIGAPGDAAPPEEATIIADALRQEGYRR
jgi:hypothetical protein